MEIFEHYKRHEIISDNIEIVSSAISSKGHIWKQVMSINDWSVFNCVTGIFIIKVECIFNICVYFHKYAHVHTCRCMESMFIYML